MSDESKQEPTMEEILASIRRIISEDDVEQSEPIEEEDGFPPQRAPDPEPEIEEEEPPPPPPEPEPELELEPDPEPEPVPEPAPAAVEQEDVLELTDRIEPLQDIEPALVSDPTAAAAAAAFGHLSASILMPHDLRTLEDVVRELLRPLLKQWLDDNLPDIVEAQVQAEIERISRSGRIR
jgi:cell pole-organizing protein PopZ